MLSRVVSSQGNPLICSCFLDYSLSPFTQNFLTGHLGSDSVSFFLFGVYFEGKYRIYCGRVRGQLADAVDFSCWICETPDDLIDFVKNFGVQEWEDGLSPTKNLEENPDAVCFQNYFGDFGASGIREELMQKPEEDFSVWKASTNEAT